MALKTQKNVAIIGLGYVGLPLMLLLCKKNNVYGFDQDQKKIDMLVNKKSYISDVSNFDLVKIDRSKLFTMNDAKFIKKCDYIIFCLPTPWSAKKPDMTYIVNAFKKIFKYLKKKQTIILESSVYTGATKHIFYKKLSKKFNIGKNFYLCYSPERIDPGKNKKYKKLSYERIDKLISGFTNNCLNKIYELYSKSFTSLHKCESIEIAETSKLFENIFRSVNIGLVNEMKVICNKLGFNIHDVISAAKTKPFGFRPFAPGPGVGGHCIPIDPLFMSWVAKKNNVQANFINLSNKTNLYISNWVSDKIVNIIKNKKIKKILLLGMAYKKDVNDSRESPSIKIFNKLNKLKLTKLDYQDKFISSVKLNNVSKKTVLNVSYKKYDCIVLLTDHSYYNYNKIYKDSKLIIDTRGVFRLKKNKVIHL